jgi:putative DNA primase/helicase
VSDFTPSSEWQDVPDDAVLPAGLEININVATGRKQARIPNGHGASEPDFQERYAGNDYQATVARLAHLSKAEYDRARKTECARLNVRSKTLDDDVEKARPQAAKGAVDEGTGQGRSLNLPEVEPWPEAVDGADLLSALDASLHRFVVLPDHAAVGGCLWVLHCHAHQAAFHSPRLAITSPVMRCGKSSLLRWLARVVPRPLPASNISAAALFRVIEAAYPTLLIDELDQVDPDKRVELVGVVNSSHCRLDAQIIRVSGEQLEPRVFSTWAPMALAAIGKLPPQWVDRSITIEMTRKLSGDRAEGMRLDLDQGFEELQRKAARWAKDHLEALRGADPVMPLSLNDRQADNWRLLLAIADLIGGEWPERARKAAVALSIADNDSDARGVQALADIQQIFDDRGDPEDLTSDAIVSALIELEGHPWAEYRRDGKPITKNALARLLKPFGIAPGNLRAAGVVVKGYARAAFVPLWNRYLKDSPTATPLHAAETLEDSGFPTATRGEDVAVANRPKPRATAACSGVADGIPPEGRNGIGKCSWCHQPIDPTSGHTATSAGEYLHNSCVDAWVRRPDAQPEDGEL